MLTRTPDGRLWRMEYQPKRRVRIWELTQSGPLEHHCIDPEPEDDHWSIGDAFDYLMLEGGEARLADTTAPRTLWCRSCGERRLAALAIDEHGDTVSCTTCAATFRPAATPEPRPVRYASRRPRHATPAA
jgi:hypothetical protein